MADGVLTSRLEQTSCKLFFGTQVLPKTEGQVLIPDFGTVKNLTNMVSNGEVIYIKKNCIMDMNIFEVWAITIRPHLKGRNYAQGIKILNSEYCWAN